MPENVPAVGLREGRKRWRGISCSQPSKTAVEGIQIPRDKHCGSTELSKYLCPREGWRFQRKGGGRGQDRGKRRKGIWQRAVSAKARGTAASSLQHLGCWVPGWGQDCRPQRALQTRSPGNWIDWILEHEEQSGLHNKELCVVEKALGHRGWRVGTLGERPARKLPHRTF